MTEAIMNVFRDLKAAPVATQIVAGIAAVALAGLIRHWTRQQPSSATKSPPRRRVDLKHVSDPNALVLWAPPRGYRTVFVHESPFVTKLDLVLKLSKAKYEWVNPNEYNFMLAPKRKMPCIVYKSELIEDSRIVLDWLQDNHAIDLDRDLSAAQRATSLAFIRMLEESVYFATLHYAFNTDEGWAYCYSNMRMPWAMKRVLAGFIRKEIRVALHGQGTGRLSSDEIVGIVRHDFDALECLLRSSASKNAAKKASGQGNAGSRTPVPTFFGTDEPTLLDTVAFAQLGCIHFLTAIHTPLQYELRRHSDLIHFLEAMCQQYYPEEFKGFIQAANSKQ